MHDEGELGIGESDHQIGLDDSMSYSSATVEEAEFDGVLEEEAFADEASEDEVFGALMGGGSQMSVCTYCSDKSCFSAQHRKEDKAKDHARKRCETRSKGSKCHFKGCKRK
jgi:hypothetical protein